MTNLTLVQYLVVCHADEGIHPSGLALTFVIPSVPRISYYAAPEKATCAAFIEESRMKFADPTKLDRKSGAVEGSAVPLS
jgi:hypothetical protein